MAAAPSGAYSPSSHRHKKSNRGKIIAIGATVVVAPLLIGLWIVMSMGKALESANKTASSSQGNASGNAQPASASVAGDPDSPHSGWIGVQELLAEQATVTIVTYDDDAKPAREFAATVTEPVSVASITLDNTRGKLDLAVDTSGAKLKMTDGSEKPAGNAGLVVATARQNPDQVKSQILSPFNCPPTQKVTGKLLLLPPGTDSHKVASVTIRINGQEKEILGTFSNDPRRVEHMRAGAAPIAPASPAPAAPAAAAAPVASQPS